MYPRPCSPAENLSVDASAMPKSLCPLLVDGSSGIAREDAAFVAPWRTLLRFPCDYDRKPGPTACQSPAMVANWPSWLWICIFGDVGSIVFDCDRNMESERQERHDRNPTGV